MRQKKVSLYLGDTPEVQRILKALGHDPAQCLAYRVVSPRRGLHVCDLKGEPVKFYTAKQLKAKRSDTTFQAAYGA